MIDFRAPTLGDREWIEKRLSARENLTCEFTFANIFSYCAKMKIEIADLNGFFVSKCHTGKTIGYCYPVGKGDIRQALSEIISDARNEEKDSR